MKRYLILLAIVASACGHGGQPNDTGVDVRVSDTAIDSQPDVRPLPVYDCNPEPGCGTPDMFLWNPDSCADSYEVQAWAHEWACNSDGTLTYPAGPVGGSVGKCTIEAHGRVTCPYTPIGAPGCSFTFCLPHCRWMDRNKR